MAKKRKGLFTIGQLEIDGIDLLILLGLTLILLALNMISYVIFGFSNSFMTILGLVILGSLWRMIVIARQSGKPLKFKVH